MKLDKRRIKSLFAMFCDLEDNELEKWNDICENAEVSIISKLRKDADVKRNMERLCIAAAASAYFDYVVMSAGSGMPSDIKVGDISIKTNGDILDARSTRDSFLAEIADLIDMPCGVAFTTAECAI